MKCIKPTVGLGSGSSETQELGFWHFKENGFKAPLVRVQICTVLLTNKRKPFIIMWSLF